MSDQPDDKLLGPLIKRLFQGAEKEFADVGFWGKLAWDFPKFALHMIFSLLIAVLVWAIGAEDNHLRINFLTFIFFWHLIALMLWPVKLITCWACKSIFMRLVFYFMTPVLIILLLTHNHNAGLLHLQQLVQTAASQFPYTIHWVGNFTVAFISVLWDLLSLAVKSIAIILGEIIEWIRTMRASGGR